MARRGDSEGHHNDGQEDRANDRGYRPPHEDPLGRYDDQEIEDRKSYREGWRHTDDQKRESSSSGGCFLTTACVDHAGLPDSCHELTVLRQFRDEILLATSWGSSLVREYYRRAPRIVRELGKRCDQSQLYDGALACIRKIVALIEDRKSEAAIEAYRNLVEDLEKLTQPRNL